MTQPTHILLQPSPMDGKPIRWYEPGERAREILDQFPDFTFSHLEWQAYAWPGGYEIHYYTKDGGVFCHQCANQELMRTIDPDDDQFYIVACQVNYEDPDRYCDHCNRRIEPQYLECEGPQT